MATSFTYRLGSALLVALGIAVALGPVGRGQAPDSVVDFLTEPQAITTAAPYGGEPLARTDRDAVQLDEQGKEESTGCNALEHKASRVSAAASLTVSPSQPNGAGMTMTAQALAQGGRTVRCVTAPTAASEPERAIVSKTPLETTAQAHAVAVATIRIQFGDKATNLPFWLGIDGHAALTGARYEYTVMAPDGSMALGASTDFASQRLLLSGKPGNTYTVRITLRADAAGNGSCCVENRQGTLVIRVFVTKADILSAPVVDQSSSGAAADQRIVGGEPTAEFPAVGAILRTNEEGTRTLHCTGTLISKRTVLTAAHCIEGFHVEQMAFVQGQSAKDLATARRVIPMTHGAVPHETNYNYDPQTFEDDIALAFLETTVPSDFMSIGDLYAGDPKLDGYAFKLTFVGFGYDVVERNKTGLGTKRKIAMGIQTTNDKKFSYGEPGKNTCNGDSGGPAFLLKGNKWVLAGIVSYGDQPCEVYGVDTRVDHYLPWIKKANIYP